MAMEQELDLHGLTVDEALPEIKRYLYDSFMAGQSSICINHGRGTGIMRQTVYRELKNHTLVKSFRQGGYGEGGKGVTIVELVDH
jgi:DNA mismatch repair protein MutS2